MQTLCIFAIVAINTVASKHVQLQEILERGAADNELTMEGFRSLHRLKRAAGLSQMVKGALSLRKLLTGTQPLIAGRRLTRNYEKPGDYSTAEKDFYSVSPSFVRESKHPKKKDVTILQGKIGDRLLKLRSRNARGEATLEIIEDEANRKPGIPYIDKITYKKTD